MALAADIIALGKKKLIDLQGIAGAQDEIKKQFFDLLALNPDGLATFVRASIDLKDFAETIDANRAQLRPWIMVYPAALGLEGPWASVLNLWCRRPIPAQAQIDPVVEETLESLFSGYARLISV